MRRWLFWVCGVAVLAQPSVADDVDDYIRKQMDELHIPGVVLLVQKNGKIEKEQAYGVANIELNVPATVNSVFPLASVTKVFTATAVYMLVQDGKLHTEDKVSDLLPGLPRAWKEITVMNCLSHTSGLPDILPGTPMLTIPGFVSAATQEEALSKVAVLPFAFKPGEKSRYNQTDFLLLRMIVEKISAIPFEQFLEKRIFKPGGMGSARFGDSLDIIPNRVAVYMDFVPETDRFRVKRKPNGDGLPSTDGTLWNDFNFLYPTYQHGGVGLNMSAEDLAAFDRSLTGEKLLAKPFLKQMWTPFRLNDGRNGEFAGGWDTEMLNRHLVVFHIGAGMVEYAHDIDSGTTVILLTNKQGFNPYRMTFNVLQFFAPELNKAAEQLETRRSAESRHSSLTLIQRIDDLPAIRHLFCSVRGMPL